MEKKVMFLLSFVIALLVLSACSEKVGDRHDLSPVRDGDKIDYFVHTVKHWAEDKDFSEMEQEEFLFFIYSVNPQLDRDMIRELTYYGKIKSGEELSLRYHYFDENGICRMENAEGDFSKVNFKDEIVVEVIRPNQENLWVAISCLNGMLDIQGQPAISADALMMFTIEKGRGLSYYLADDYWSINVAEEFDLPLFKGKKQSSKYLISPIQARELVPEVDKVQITVFVKEGWTFVLSAGKWTLNGLTAEELKRL
jgi:hypothetical protein